MSRVPKRALWGAGIALLVALAIGLIWLRSSSHPSPSVTSQVVPASWEQYRTSPGHQSHVGKGTIACNDCHDHAVQGFVNPGAGICLRCHEKQAARSHLGGEHKKTDCLTCHLFAPDRAAVTCLQCHAEAQAQLPAVTVHRTTDCASCHHPHETPPVVGKPCAECHEERAPSHREHAGSQDCADCHKPHAPAKAARETCSSCHKAVLGHQPAGHASCLSCHAPHGFVAQAPQVCVGCHGAKPTLLAALAGSAPTPHARCTSCHAPHAPGNAAASCQGCHAEVHVDHRGHDACVSCHAPHAADPTVKAGACTQCHAAVAASDRGAHLGNIACTQCHRPHNFPAPTSKLTLCAGCHASETSRTAGNRGHSDCASCHGAKTHQPTGAPACASCHVQEAASAPRGHQLCTQCHDAHSGKRVPVAATCLGCHQNKAKVLHANLATGCETCHHAHGPGGVASPPTCASCHRSDKLPALHGAPGHSVCGKCHTSHAGARSDRETCTSSCHLNRRDHQPQASVCSGCHVFRD